MCKPEKTKGFQLDGKLSIRLCDEDSTQDLASEPVCNLILDFLLIICGSLQSLPYRRLLDLIVFNNSYDEEREYQIRAKWNRFIEKKKCEIAEQEVDLSTRDGLVGLVDEVINAIGRDAIVALSHGYTNGEWLDQKIEETVNRVHDLLKDGDEAVDALASFSGDQALRIMSIHKSKGLEFDTVIVLGVENETFWGQLDEERSAYFVALSRAKRRLFLTVCQQRERPDGARRWYVNRTEHVEFLGYVEPYL